MTGGQSGCANEMKYTEKEIIMHLQLGSSFAEREQGVAMMMEQYTGLLWSVCQRRLQDPEDIKECVNSTFAEVCFHPERDDGEKGSLKNYLCMMVDRKSIDRYHQNVRRQQAEENYSKEQEQLENSSTGKLYGGSDRFLTGNERAAEKLEEALEQLDLIDSQILRMKYYDGMSYQEIAKRMGLTEGTVKMRSLRSRKKLFKMLIIVLILALLAACAVAVLHKYQFSERGGFVWSEESSVYRLAEGKISWETDGIRYHLVDAIWTRQEEDSLVGEVKVYITEEWLIERPSYRYFNVLEVIEAVKNNPPMDLEMINNVGYGRREQNYQWSHYENGVIEYELKLKWNLEEENPDKIIMPLYVDQQWLTDIVLEPLDMEEYEDSGDGLRLHNGTKWSLGPALAGERQTIISLFGPHNEEMALSSRIYTSRYLSSPLESTPTLVGRDGTSYAMMRAVKNLHHFNWMGDIAQCDLSFPVVEPGKYELHIPAVCYESNWASKEFTLCLPQEENVRRECDVTSLFPDGSGLHFIGITKTAVESVQYDLLPGEEVPREVKFYYWEYILDYELRSADNMEFCLATLQTTEENGFTMGNFPENGQITFFIDREQNLDQITLYLENPEYIVYHDFVIPVTVEIVAEKSRVETSAIE